MSQRSAARLHTFCLSIAVVLSASLICFLAAGRGVSGQTANSSGSQELPVLELNNPIDRQMTGGQIHNYRIKLEAGQYIKVEIFQYWISVWPRLYDPAGNLVLELKLHNENAETEMLSAIVEKGGDFRLEIETLGVTEIRGSYRLTLATQQKATPQNQLLVEADRMQLEAYAMARKGKWESAIPLSEKGIAQYEKVFGANHLELVEPLKLLAVLLMFKGDLVNREKVSKRILHIQELALGRDHLNTTEGLLHLGTTYLGGPQWLEGKEVFAKSLLERALRMREAILKPNDMRIAQVASDLGILHLSLSEYTQAEALLRRAMTIAEQELGPASYFVVMRWNDLAEVKAVQGEYGEAAALWERGVESAEKHHPGSPVYAAMMANLGQLSMDTGNYDRAKQQLEHALPLYEKFWGLESSNMAELLTLLGRLSFEQREIQSAEQFHRRALTLREKIFGMNHAFVATSLLGLAKALQAQQKYDEAEAAYQRALQINEKIYSEKDWRWGAGMRDWGKLYQERGDYVRAEQFIRRALMSYEQSLGLNHPYVFEARSDLMTLCLAQGRVNDALIEQQQAAKISELNLSRNLMAGSENQKLRYLEKFRHEIDDTVSLHVNHLPNQPEAMQLAFQTLLRRKSRALDEMGGALQLLRLRAGSVAAKVFDKLSDRLAQLSVLTTRGPENLSRENYLAKVHQVNEDIEKLQSELSKHSLEFQATAAPTTLESVRKALPANAALVEFIRFKPSGKQGLKDKAGDQYAAYILLSDGTLSWTPLGNADEIESLVKAWLRAIAPKQPNETFSISQVKKLASQVDTLVMQPVRKKLKDVRQIFVAPDGDLHLVPFAAMVYKQERYLLEDYQFIYLTSGRDLVRLQTKHKSQQDKIIFAVSDFDKIGEPPIVASGNQPRAVSDSRSGVLSSDTTMATITFGPLGFAREEGVVIKKLFPEAKLYADGQATETLLKQARRPYFLHLTTHGFFLPNDDKNKENALLRSGLVFAGANQRKSGKDDGILTAYEAAALDLWGTRLVVLSACETGNGEVKNGEGVFGLRRALVLAGVETQVASLWKASDQATRKLMESFYRKLSAGMGRAQALRQAQLEMLRSGYNSEPYKWANFICVGEWKPLD